MALTRKLLSAMGIEDEKIEEIISAHTEVTKALKEQSEQYKEQAEKYEQTAKELKTAKDKIVKLEEAAKDTPPDEYKEKYEKVKAEFDTYKADISSKELKAKKEAAYKAILKDAKVPEKHWDKIIKYSDIDKLNLKDDGKFENDADIMKSLKEEWGEYVGTEGKSGATVPTPPANNGGGQPEESYAAKRIREQREQLYGKVKED